MLLDAEIDSLNDLIKLYEDKIKLLEGTQAHFAAEPDKTRINEKGERVKVGKHAGSTLTRVEPDKIDYFHYF